LCQAESLAIVPGTIPIASIVADSAEATGLKWAAPAGGGGMTQIATGSLSGASLDVALTGTYKKLEIFVTGFKPSVDGYSLELRLNNDSTANRYYNNKGFAQTTNVSFNSTRIDLVQNGNDLSTDNNLTHIVIPDYTNTTSWKMVEYYSVCNWYQTATNLSVSSGIGLYNQTGAITSITFICEPPHNMSAGTYYIYGVN
jgi:hypothetical protein